MIFNFFRLWIIVVVSTLLTLAPAAGEGARIRHGEDSSFRTETLGVCWGNLRSPDSDVLKVVIRIRILDPEANPFGRFAVKAVHPFSGAVEWIAVPQPLSIQNDVWTPREDFKRLGGRQILFYRSATASESQTPDLVVDYLGIPDTTPEFSDPDQMERYFTIAFDRLREQ
ncbi:MAG: hypothetical protein ACOWWM_17165 [Desulfobacterales bacterium]